MRYSSEFKRKWNQASGPAIDAGKKMLGYLSNQKRLSGVDTISQREVLDDGSIVEARFDKDIPSVRIFPPDGGEGCELYLESGLLDLGQNTSADAGTRFGRGVPRFNSQPATLHFGTDVDCPDGQPGIVGRVRIDGNLVKSQCLPVNGPSVQSRLNDPVKKQAQAVLPASSWSGLMQRYVQAVYGGKELNYKLLGETGLELGAGRLKAQVTPFNAATMGLVRIGDELAFVVIETGGLVKFYGQAWTPCARAVYALWKRRQDSPVADKLLTLALSGCIPYGELGQVQLDLEKGQHCRGYGWSFTDAKACAALHDDDQSWVSVITFTHTNGIWDAEVKVGEKAGLPPRLFAITMQASANGVEIVLERKENVYLPQSDRLSAAVPIECPIAAWFEKDEVVTVTYSIQGQGIPDGLDGFSACDGAVRSHNPMIHTVPNAAHNCNAQLYEQFNSGGPDYLHGSGKSAKKTTVALGIYAKRGESVIWSTIRARDAWSVSRPSVDGGTPCLYLTLYADLMMVENPTPVWDDELTIFETTPQPGLGGSLNQSNPTAQVWPEYDYRLWDTVASGTDSRCNDVVDTPHYVAGTGFTAAAVIAAVPERCWYNGGPTPTATLGISWDNIYTGQGYQALEWWYWHTVGVPAMTVGTSLAICVMDLQGQSRGLYVGEIATAGEKFGPQGIVARKHKPGATVYAAKEKNDHSNFRIQICRATDDPVGEYDLPISFTHSDEMGTEGQDEQNSFAYFHKNGLPWDRCDNHILCFTSPLISPFSFGSPECTKRSVWDGGRASEEGAFLCYSNGSLSQPDLITGQLRVAALKNGGDADLTGPTLRAGHSCSSIFTGLFNWFAGTAGSLNSGHDPLMIETKIGDKPAFKTYPISFGGIHVLKVEPRRAMSSLLGCSIYNDRPDAFGASIGMDRETITGGYSPVSSPSFVGWA